MLAVNTRSSIAPPATRQGLMPWVLALSAHGLLMLALTWGVSWQRQTPHPVFEAEIWSPQVQAAAPAPEPTPPEEPATPPAEPPSPPPAPEPAPAPTPAPAKPVSPAPSPATADLATQKRQAQAAQQAAEQAAADKAAAERREQARQAAAKKAAEKAAEQAAAKKAAEAAEKAAAEQARQEQARLQAEQKALEEQAKQAREAQLQRIMNQASATGSTGTSRNPGNGSAAQASGPSPQYGARVAARIKPNVVFTEAISGNPRAEVEVSTLPDGTISSRRIVKSSGNAAWDDAVLRAIDRTGTLPRDVDGRVPSPLIIGLRPQD